MDKVIVSRQTRFISDEAEINALRVAAQKSKQPQFIEVHDLGWVKEVVIITVQATWKK